jgi:hypothetical protein
MEEADVEINIGAKVQQSSSSNLSKSQNFKTRTELSPRT